MKKQQYMNFDEYSKTFVQAWREFFKTQDAAQLYRMQDFAQFTSSIFGCTKEEKTTFDNWFFKNVLELSPSTRILFAQFLTAKDDKSAPGKKFIKMIQPIGDLYVHIPFEYNQYSNERQQHVATALFFIHLISLGKIKDKSVAMALLRQSKDVLENNMNVNIVDKSHKMIQARQK